MRHPYDWAGPVFVGVPRENCGLPPRAGSILDSRNDMVVKAAVPKAKPKKVAPASDDAPPTAMPTNMPTAMRTHVKAKPKAETHSENLSPVVHVAELDDSGWRPKRSDCTTTQ